MASQNGADAPTAFKKLKFSKIDHYLVDNVVLLRLSSLNGMVKKKTGAVAHSSRLLAQHSPVNRPWYAGEPHQHSRKSLDSFDSRATSDWMA